MKFLEYLQQVHNKLNCLQPKEAIRIILGNESCDLDSMVSALALAYLYSMLDRFKHTTVIPMMNKPKEMFPIRVENIYVLGKYNICPGLLCFKDSLDLTTLQKDCNFTLTLVDFHVLNEHDKYLKKSVVEIVDHRPIDKSEVWDMSVQRDIQLVGSCSTLVTSKFKLENKSNESILKEVAGLLYDAITFDTVAYKESAGKVKALDLEMATLLENALNIPLNNAKYRQNLFDQLWNAHSDVSSLTSEQLLYKDLKIIGDVVHIPGLPMLINQYLQRVDAMIAIESFYSTNTAKSVLLMGLEVDKDIVNRDLALYCKDPQLLQKLDSVIVNKFEVEKHNLNLDSIHYYRQKNPTLSRKQLIPLLQSVIY